MTLRPVVVYVSFEPVHADGVLKQVSAQHFYNLSGELILKTTALHK